jgi:hypothetical protein
MWWLYGDPQAGCQSHQDGSETRSGGNQLWVGDSIFERDIREGNKTNAIYP